MAAVAAWSLAAGACVGERPIHVETVGVASCRGTNASTSFGKPAVRWIAGIHAGDRAIVDRWCRGVGPAVHLPPSRVTPAAAGTPVAVVSWNVNVGAGDVGELVADLRAGRFSSGSPVAHFVLLLQEAFRSGPDVPAIARGQSGARRLVRAARPVDIVSFAREEGLSLFYVPSMRNGFDADHAEDRGNAILSTLPLTDLRALELPFERQRRVVAIATLERAGSALPATVAAVHLDPFVSSRRLWLFGAVAARARQARALAEALAPEAQLVIGGDFNTWSGTHEPALREMQRMTDRGPISIEPTFGDVHVLDYLFFRMPSPGRSGYRRASHTYGSDHFPLVGWIADR